MSDVSIALKLTGNMSEALTSIRNSMTPFRDDLDDLQKELDVLNATKIDLKVDVDKAKRALADAKKAFYALGEEARDDTPVREAQANYEALAEKLDLVSRQAKQAEKDMRSAADVDSRMDNRAASRGSGSSLLSGLGQAGLFDMLGSTLSDGANALVGSAFGSEAGGLFSSALSGAGTGAAIGSMIAPGVGTAVGAALGGIVGLVGGATQNFEQQDEAFKAYYKDQYDQAEAERARMTTSGSTLAAQRETDQIAFSKLLGGEAVASSYLEDVRDMANHTPFLYGDLTDMSKSLAPAFGDDPKRMLELLEAIGNAGASVGLGVSDMQQVGTAISRMESTGKTTLEYLNLLQERGIDAYGFLSEGLGKSKEEMLEMVSKGLIPGADAARMIQEGMEGAYRGAMELQSATYSGLTSTVQGLRQELDAAKGEGYNDTRKSALEEEIDYLDGPMGERMKEAYRQMGEWEASIENEGEALQRKVMEAVMTGTLPQDMSEGARRQISELIDLYNQGGTDSGQALARAQTLAADLYYESEGYQELLSYQKSLAGGIREDADVINSWRDAGYALAQEFTKGMAYWMSDSIHDLFRADSYVNAPGEVRDTVEVSPRIWEDNPYTWEAVEGSHAAGLRRVPYDGYLALLHQGEEVRTAAEARAGEAVGGGLQITISGNEFHVREEADVDAVAEAIVEKIRLARLAGVEE